MRAPALTRAQLLAYALPGLPLAVLYLPLYVTVPAFYADTLGLGFATVGAVLFASRIWDVVTDPAIGTLSDRTRVRPGRRRLWMLAGVPVTVAAAWVLLRPGEDAGALYLLFASFALYLGGTMVALPYTAWNAEIARDPVERSRASAAREGALVLGTLAAMAVPALLALDVAATMGLTAMALAVLIPVCVIAAVAALPDPVPEAAPAPRGEGEGGLRRAFAPLLANRPFRRLVSAYFLNGIAYGLPATLFLLFVEHVLDAAAWQWILLIVYFACAVLAMPGWVAVSRRIGKRRTWVAAMALSAVGFVPAVFLGAGDIAWFVAICVVTGAALGAELVMPPSLQADIVDLDARLAGRPRAGLLFGIWGVATKLPLAVAVVLAFPALEAAGFAGSSGENGPWGLVALSALYALLPVAFKLWAIALVRHPELDLQADGER